MAEFCYACYRAILQGDKQREDFIFWDKEERCEGCGAYRHLIVREKRGCKKRVRKTAKAQLSDSG